MKLLIKREAELKNLENSQLKNIAKNENPCLAKNTQWMGLRVPWSEQRQA